MFLETQQKLYFMNINCNIEMFAFKIDFFLQGECRAELALLELFLFFVTKSQKRILANPSKLVDLRRKISDFFQKGIGRLPLNFLKQLRQFWRSVEHVNESHMSSNSENEIDHNTSRKSENPFSDPIITDENTYHNWWKYLWFSWN